MSEERSGDPAVEGGTAGNRTDRLTKTIRDQSFPNVKPRDSATLILIDPHTGAQTRVASGTSFYKISPGVVLEEIYDEYAADDVSMGS